jgi:hypothetical protein
VAGAITDALTPQFPSLATISEPDWTFFATVGGVHVAVALLLSSQTTEEAIAIQEPLMAVLSTELNAWDANALPALLDCGNYVDARLDSIATPESGLTPYDLVAWWILHNCYGRSPSYDESLAGRAIAGILVKSFRTWWA